ncbi:hypothetical protein ACHAPJ_011217 [Fusarium lateritium]
MPTPYTVRWGIMATGWIAEYFSKDLLTDPTSRGTHDIRHELTVVASSTSEERARAFINKIDGPKTTKAYGSYADLVADPDIDIIHIGTPHSHHFQNAMLAIQAGKNVLCEKALTVTPAQAKVLYAAAKEKNVFLMEAVWTRYFPISIQVRELIQSGAIGTVYRTFARDLPDGKLDIDDSHRLISPDLAGGSLLDLGIYSLTWVFQTLYHVQPEAEKEPPVVIAAVEKYHTGTDESATVTCQFPKHKSMGIATSSFRIATECDGSYSAGPPVRIQGSKGEIHLTNAPCFRPTDFKIIRTDGTSETVQSLVPGDPKRGGWGHGMFWEADEAARCLRDGKKESTGLPWSESILIMETMDKVLQQGGVVYPESITSDVFDPNSPQNTGKR